MVVDPSSLTTQCYILGRIRRVFWQHSSHITATTATAIFYVDLSLAWLSFFWSKNGTKISICILLPNVYYVHVFFYFDQRSWLHACHYRLGRVNSKTARFSSRLVRTTRLAAAATAAL